MIKEVKLPEVSDNVETGDVIKVLVAVGDKINIDQPVIELETDKASFEVPSTESGIVKEINVKQGDIIRIGAVILKVETNGAGEKKAETSVEKIKDVIPDEKAKDAVKEKSNTETKDADKAKEIMPSGIDKENTIETDSVRSEDPAEYYAGITPAPASPSVRRLARELGVDISSVRGSDTGGRITEDDVKNHVKTLFSSGTSTGISISQKNLPDFKKWGNIEIQGMSKVRYITSVSLFNNIYSKDRSDRTIAYVSGRVIDERSFPVPLAKIIINGSETETDKEGKFKILNVSVPYDLTIAEKSTATAIVYKNISIDNPELIFFGKPNTKNANSAVISVTFPEIPAGSSAILKFISADVFYSEEIEVFSGETSKTLLVYWPQSKRSLNGNVIYLQKNNITYEQYKDKVVSLYNNTIPFKANITNLSSSKTETSDLIVYLPFKDYITKGYSIYADFFAYNRNSEVLLIKEEGNIFRTKSFIPSVLPIAYRLKVTGFVKYKDGSGFVNSEYSKPGTAINLTTETPPEPQTPTDKFLGANGNTEFYYSIGSGTGIYVLEYHSNYPGMNFYIVTGERSAYLTFLSRKEFRKGTSVEFIWKVKKYLTYFSVNDFVKPKEFKNDIGYKAILYSKERTFKTGYY